MPQRYQWFARPTASVLLLGVLAQPVLAQPPAGLAVPEPPAVAAAAHTATNVRAISPDSLGWLIGGPTLVTLHLKNATPVVALAALSEQSGLILRPWPDASNNGPLVTLDCERTPFWAAVRQLGWAPNSWENDPPSVTITIANQSLPPVQGRGPLLLSADRLEQNRAVTFGAQPEAAQFDESCNLSLSLMFDPHLHPASQCQFKLEKAVDEKGISLLPLAPPDEEPDPQGWRDCGFGQVHNLTLPVTVPLRLSPRAGERLAQFKGALRFFQVTKFESWEVPDILNAKNVVKNISAADGNASYRVESVQPAGDTYSAQLAVERQMAGQDRTAFRVSEAFNAANLDSVRLLDKQGQALNGQVTTSSGNGGNQIYSQKFTMTFKMKRENAAATGPPDKLVWQIPLEVKAVELPFEFTDLPLPR